MKKFEYEIKESPIALSLAKLNMFGNVGWELVSVECLSTVDAPMSQILNGKGIIPKVTKNISGYRYIFKRERNSNVQEERNI